MERSLTSAQGELLRLRNILLMLAVSGVAAFGLAACGGGDDRSTGTAATQAAPNEVAAFDFGFGPEELTVKPGTTVTWTTTGERIHTVKGKGFFSNAIDPGGEYEFTFYEPRTLRVRGGVIPPVKYNYHCTLHPKRMRGTIVVSGWR
jgi:plastocyanin